MTPASADPLTVTIHIENVERFAKVLAATNGRLTASDIEKGYLDQASYGVSVFTPGRLMRPGWPTKLKLTRSCTIGRFMSPFPA